MRIGIVGATGAVGLEILSVLERNNISPSLLRCFASSRSVGKTVSFKGQEIPIEPLKEENFCSLDVVLFCAGKKVSLEFIPQAVKRGAIVIDAGSAFRMDPKVPLIIPEINPEDIHLHQGIIASPNCSTTIMLLPLFPLHKVAKIKKIVVATYQAASGAGNRAMEELQEETRATLEGKAFTRQVIPHPYAFNLFVHNSPLDSQGYVEEELKMLYETRKILHDDSIHVNATCIRVPILRAHSEAIHVTFEKSLSPEAAERLLQKAPGVSFLENREKHHFAMPLEASHQDPVFCGRIRADLSDPHALNLWVVGDQLLKGAALNVVQILSLLKEKTLCDCS